MNRRRINLLILAGAIAISFAVLAIRVRSIDDLRVPFIRATRRFPPRLVILYVPCTVNRDYLGIYNESVDYTPNLNALAETGVVFERHVSEAGYSGVAYASIFSGTQAPHHGILFHPSHIGEEVYLISEAFADAGYETFFWDPHPMASSELGYGQAVATERTFNHVPTRHDPALAKILRALREDTYYRVFIQMSFHVTHGPYRDIGVDQFCRAYPGQCRGVVGENESEEFRRFVQLYYENYDSLRYNFREVRGELFVSPEDFARFVAAVELLYKVNINALDAIFGGIVGEIEDAGLLDETLISFTADHGELMYRDNAIFNWTHGSQLAPEVLTVPWLIWTPQSGAMARRFESVTRSTDVFPTIAGLAELNLPPAKTSSDMGADLSEALAGNRLAPELEAYSHTGTRRDRTEAMHPDWKELERYLPNKSVEDIWVSVRLGDLVFKYRYFGAGEWGYEAFDLAADPEERIDIYDSENADHRDTAARLDHYRERLINSYLAGGKAKVDLTDEQIDELRKLGYIQ